MNARSRIGAFFDIDGTLLAAPSLERRFLAYLFTRDLIHRKQFARWTSHFAKTVLRTPHATIHANKFYLAGLSESLAINWENSLAPVSTTPDLDGRATALASYLGKEGCILGGRDGTCPQPCRGSSDINHSFSSGVSTAEVQVLTYFANRPPCCASLPVFAEGIERIAWHLSQGHRIFFVTGTIEPLTHIFVRIFRRILARQGLAFPAEIRATPLETCAEVCTGKIAGQHMSGREKAMALRAIAVLRVLSLAESYAYGNSCADVPMLEAVGHPVAVNPQRRLTRIARRRGWDVCHWRSLNLAATSPVIVSETIAAMYTASSRTNSLTSSAEGAR